MNISEIMGRLLHSFCPNHCYAYYEQRGGTGFLSIIARSQLILLLGQAIWRIIESIRVNA